MAILHMTEVCGMCVAIGHVFYQALLLRARCVVVSGCSMFHVGR